MGREWIIPAESELRCEVKENETLVVHLHEGNAEIFGIELAHDRKYYFTGEENIAVFTWYGCKLETDGTCQSSAMYTSNETPMTALVNVHGQLEARRDVALLNGDRGPRVLLAGPRECGQSTAARILAMYAARLDRTPVLADIDVAHSLVCSVSGCVGAIAVDDRCLSLEENFDAATPLVHFFGHTSPEENLEWYKQQVSSLASTIADKHAADADGRASGLIVNTGAWNDQGGGTHGLEILHHAIEAFEIDIVLVIGHDRLYASLQEWSNTRVVALKEKDTDNWRQPTAHKALTIAKLPRSGGVVARTEASRRRARRSLVHEYFYGKKVIVAGEEQPPRYRPHRQELSLSSCTFFSCGGVRLSESMRPLGQEKAAQGGAAVLQPVPPSMELEHAVLAVLQAQEGAAGPESNSSDGQRTPANIAGFVYVVKLEQDLNTVTVLSPCPGKLPSLDFVVGSIKWVE
mmetsp:Transcript_26229/g.44221  ORF Transcript_26229/g.44221 Transcript_26229/m.44221 type:complete len:462 (+) Transcript_26229:177-1562(+)